MRRSVRIALPLLMSLLICHATAAVAQIGDSRESPVTGGSGACSDPDTLFGSDIEDNSVSYCKVPPFAEMLKALDAAGGLTDDRDDGERTAIASDLRSTLLRLEEGRKLLCIADFTEDLDLREPPDTSELNDPRIAGTPTAAFNDFGAGEPRFDASPQVPAPVAQQDAQPPIEELHRQWLDCLREMSRIQSRLASLEVQLRILDQIALSLTNRAHASLTRSAQLRNRRDYQAADIEYRRGKAFLQLARNEAADIANKQAEVATLREKQNQLRQVLGQLNIAMHGE